MYREVFIIERSIHQGDPRGGVSETACTASRLFAASQAVYNYESRKSLPCEAHVRGAIVAVYGHTLRQ
jgi:hypothetical protein